MSAQPLPLTVLPQPSVRAPRAALPDYMPARMVNEFVYCPRLFFYEWVDGLFRESADTIEGAAQHKRVDARASALPAPGEALNENNEKIHARSVTLSSERLRVIAKLDLVEVEGQSANPVDYKHASPREGKDGTIRRQPEDDSAAANLESLAAIVTAAAQAMRGRKVIDALKEAVFRCQPHSRCEPLIFD